MHHSHSTPAGVDGGARTPPATPKKGGKMLAIRVQMLDDAVTIFQVQVRVAAKLITREVPNYVKAVSKLRLVRSFKKGERSLQKENAGAYFAWLLFLYDEYIKQTTALVRLERPL
jgi:hypothetical protein